MAETLDSKSLDAEIKSELLIRPDELERENGGRVGLAVVRVRASSASNIHESNMNEMRMAEILDNKAFTAKLRHVLLVGANNLE
ncbi:MAG: hypothetical protein K2O39_02635, partial [Clostridiales bacterium]|nr:hypothetical protein [Clostridiales bacterium]